MPAPIPERTALKAEILRRVTAGETIKAVCATPGFPRPVTVHSWKRTDASFDAALSEAVRRSQWRRRHAFREDQARAFLARLAAGEALRRLVRDPSMPNARTLSEWRATHGAFAAEVHRLLSVFQAERLARRGLARLARYRPWTQAEGDRVLACIGRGEPIAALHRADPSLPEPWLIQRWRRESPAFAHDLAFHIRRGHRMRPGRLSRLRREALVDRVCEAIAAGESFNSLQRRAGMPTRHTLGHWVRIDPEFARRVAQACDDRDETLVVRKLAILERGQGLSIRQLRRSLAPLSMRIAGLRIRPGFRRARRDL